MDWADERWVKLYTRDTDDILALSWDARAVLWEMLRKADRIGFVQTKRGARGLSTVTRIPFDVLERCLPELTEGEGAPLESVADGYLLRNFLAAQESITSNKERQRRFREKHATVTPRYEPVTLRYETVTDGNAPSRAVTTRVEESRGDETREEEKESAPPARGAGKPRTTSPAKPKTVLVLMPSDWEPSPELAAEAVRCGVDLAAEMAKMRDWALANAVRKADWNATARNWIRKASEMREAGRKQNGNGKQTALGAVLELVDQDRAKAADVIDLGLWVVK